MTYTKRLHSNGVREVSARRRAHTGTTLVEFALIAPVAFVLLFGSIVVATIVFDQLQLTNAARDGSRAAAICGGASRTSGTTLPNGAACTTANVEQYIYSELQSVPANIAITVTVYLAGGTTSTDLDQCSAQRLVQINASYAQSLYVPLVGQMMGAGTNDTKTISASASSVCMQ